MDYEHIRITSYNLASLQKKSQRLYARTSVVQPTIHQWILERLLILCWVVVISHLAVAVPDRLQLSLCSCRVYN